MSDANTASVSISPERLNGLEYKAKSEGKKLGYRISKAALLDKILTKAGVEELSDNQFSKLMKELEVT